MKKLLFILLLLPLWVSAQVPPHLPLRSPGNYVIQENYFRAQNLGIPYTASTTPTLNNAPTSAGYGFQLLSDGRLAVWNGSAWVYYTNSTSSDSTVFIPKSFNPGNYYKVNSLLYFAGTGYVFSPSSSVTMQNGLSVTKNISANYALSATNTSATGYGAIFLGGDAVRPTIEVRKYDNTPAAGIYGDGHAVFNGSVTSTAHVTNGGTNSQVVLGDGTLGTYNAGGGAPYLTKTANYTILTSDFNASGELYIYADCTSGVVTLTLPSAATMAPSGKTYKLTVFKIDASANACNISGGATNINGATTYAVTPQYASVTITSNSTQYYAK